MTLVPLLAALLPAALQPPAGAAPPPPRPAYHNLRYEENWSVLRGQPNVDFWDPIKFIPLTEDERIYLTLGGDMRVRVEHFENFAFGAPATDTDTYLLTRIKLHADLHVGDHFRAFVEAKSALATDRDLPGGRRRVDVDEFDLQNAFVDLKLPIADATSLTFRPGRQELQYGRQRLVSPLDWANTRRTFDGARGILRLGDWRIDGFWTQPVRVRKYDFNRRDSDQDFYGIYAAGKLPTTALGWDIYWLGLERERATFGGLAGEEERHTVGTRLGGPIGPPGFDFDTEFAYQFGDHADRDISAYMASIEAGYTFVNVGMTPRLEFGFDYASGDNNPGDGRLRTFNQLFPLGHAFLGFIDVVGRQNIMAFRSGVSFKPVQKLTIRIDGHLFYRAERGDALYDAGGGVVRAGNLGDAREVGQEIDLTARYDLDRHTSFLFGYSHFFAGRFIEQSGASDDIDFFYASVEYRF
jgi:hypothetical protein